MTVTSTSHHDDQTRTYLVGRVISHKRVTVHVHSDSAMLDSGQRLQVCHWDPETFRVNFDNFATDDNRVDVTDDASDEDKQHAERSDEAREWFNRNLRQAKERVRIAENMEQHDVVEVFKGRKVPKGEYIVEKFGSNSYGSYAHLKDRETGDLHKFINPANIRSTKVATFRSEQEAFFNAIAQPEGTASTDKSAVHVLCDWLTENGSTAGDYILGIQGLYQSAMAMA